MSASNFLSNSLAVLTAVLCTLLLGVQRASAVPSFARQTGLPCSGCHTIFPELNAFGRNFKLNAYTMVGTPTISVSDSEKQDILKLLASGPLSAMVTTSFTHIQKKDSDTQYDNVDFPQELSVFLAGEITPHVGTFTQLTYSQSDGSVSLDNTDLRFANTVGKLIYGIDMNNNPTVQDVWNTLPAWRFPYQQSAVAPGPAASVQLDDTLAQRVAGIGGYFSFDQLVYTEVSFYHSAVQGGPNPPDSKAEDTLQGVAPYWRLALEHGWDTHYIQVGTFGIVDSKYPTGIHGPTNHFIDTGFDSQFEEHFDTNTLVVHASWIHETQTNDAAVALGSAANNHDHQDSLHANAAFYFWERYAGSLGYFNTFGNSDQILYAPGAVTGSRNGKPDTDGFVTELDYTPWLNTKLAAQYVFYNRFNGSSSNYDGSGRGASGNDTLYLLGWLAF